ncbi:hypothetical protein F2P81_020814 [Scophthalmus maximus]|uniref:Uncharacterized protein n=1 Tax=Scophthalmus maximus TaxID=52904 RepID=A0A6A4RZL5_SCOMX|nr:hypothetical protein F2P81_020814 [Scophthalmus maximus]
MKTVYHNTTFYSDISNIVDMINKRRSHRLDISRQLTTVSALHQFIIRTFHIPRHKTLNRHLVSRSKIQTTSTSLRPSSDFRSHRFFTTIFN